MPIETATKTIKELQTEYDRLYLNEPVRDEDRAYRWFARSLRDAKPSVRDILDVACGGGYFMHELDRTFEGRASITGIDVSGQALNLARRECPRARLVLAASEALPFQEGRFDAITCLGSLEHFLDIERAVDEMKRVIRPEGLFFILVPNIFWYKDILSVFLTGGRKVRNQTHERFASLLEWKELLEGCGLRVLKTHKYNGIAKHGWKQGLKDWLIPLKFSYHFLFICKTDRR